MSTAVDIYVTPSKKLIGMIFQLFKSKNKHGKNITALFKNSSMKGMNGHCCFGEEIWNYYLINI